MDTCRVTGGGEIVCVRTLRLLAFACNPMLGVGIFSPKLSVLLLRMEDACSHARAQAPPLHF